MATRAMLAGAALVSAVSAVVGVALQMYAVAVAAAGVTWAAALALAALVARGEADLSGRAALARAADVMLRAFSGRGCPHLAWTGRDRTDDGGSTRKQRLAT